MRRACLLGVLLVASCQPPLTIAFDTPAPTPTTQAAEGPVASFDCFEASSAAERAVCTEPALAAQDLAMGRIFHRDLRISDMFGRDMLLASQRRWLAMRDRCLAQPCLLQAYEDRIRDLSAWSRTARPASALARYAPFKPLMQADPALCGEIASAPDAASDHAVDTTRDGRPIVVARQDANVYGGYQNRARAVRVAGAEVLDALSLGALVRAQDSNLGGRFSAYASQTGDYGDIRVFRLHGATLAMLEDPVGFYAPATAGEYAHAGVWVLDHAPPRPLCLFQTFHMPPEHGPFDALPAFSAWRDRLHAIAASAALDADTPGVTALRDESQFRAEAEWMLVNMPLVVRDEAQEAAWTPWLRHRHDAALDALLAWSRRDPSRRTMFDQLFALLHPAAQELVTAFQQIEGLSADEAKQAGALAIMEFTYGAAADLPEMPQMPQTYPEAAPRHAILAVPG